jgi:hypothetical protein
MPWWPLVASLAISAAKSHSDSQKEKADRQYQSELIRNSPWTGMQSTLPQRADTFGTMAQGLATGLSLDQAMDSQEKQNEMLDAKKAYFERGAGPTARPYAEPMMSRVDSGDNLDDFTYFQNTGRARRLPSSSYGNQGFSTWAYL